MLSSNNMNTKLAALVVTSLFAFAPMIASAQFVTDCSTAAEGAACISGDMVSTCVTGDSGRYCDVANNGTKVTVDASGQPVFTDTTTSGSSAAPTGPGGGSGSSVAPTGSGGGSGSSVAPTGGNTVRLINPLSAGTSLESFLMAILSFVIRLGTIVVVFMLIFVGFKFVMAQGEPGKITEARNMLMWTLIGALILLGAQAIAIGIKATVQALSVGK